MPNEDPSITRYFAGLPDPRVDRTTKYLPGDVLVIALSQSSDHSFETPPAGVSSRTVKVVGIWGVRGWGLCLRATVVWSAPSIQITQPWGGWLHPGAPAVPPGLT